MADSIHIRPEPVAWMYEQADGKWPVTVFGKARWSPDDPNREFWTETPLYTAPQGSEREAIVAWLRTARVLAGPGPYKSLDVPIRLSVIENLIEAIERGDHLPPPPTDNGGQ